MKKFILSFFIVSLVYLPLPAAAAAKATAEKILPLSQIGGYFLLQKESYNRIWYVNPGDKQRYALDDEATIINTLRSLGRDISAKDLANIPTRANQKADSKLVNRLRGYILIPDDDEETLWYLNPANGWRYPFTDGKTALDLIGRLAKKASNQQLAAAGMNQSQIAFDGLFNNIAHVGYDGVGYEKTYYGDQILPLASMTKLMTALALLDLNPDWDRKVTITKSQIDYPSEIVGGDATSEIEIKVGDRIAIKDLWVAMLVASSNQSAVALADATSLTKEEFVGLMNKKTRDLGLKKTVFYDVTGLDARNVTTPKEMAIIANLAFASDKIAGTSIITGYQVPATDTENNTRLIEIINRNNSLLQYQPQGVKTGYLVEAQRTVSLKVNGKIIVVMHALSMAQRNRVISKLLGIDG